MIQEINVSSIQHASDEKYNFDSLVPRLSARTQTSGKPGDEATILSGYREQQSFSIKLDRLIQ